MGKSVRHAPLTIVHKGQIKVAHPKVIATMEIIVSGNDDPSHEEGRNERQGRHQER